MIAALGAMVLLVFFFLVFLIVPPLSSINPSAATHPQISKHILFIGNSYTFYNDGIDKQIEGLAPASQTQRLAVGGYTLENHWNDSNTLQAIRAEGWDYVVLQEQSQTPVSDRNKFFEFARKLNAEIIAHGAKTVFLMTWERPDSIQYQVTTANLAAAYHTIGAELGAQVAPAGLAFARSRLERPDLILYSQDGHPTMDGTYLAACVLYATMFRISPVGNSYSDWSINAETRAYFQRLAAETVGF